MARPVPNVLMKTTLDNHYELEVVEAEQFFSVYYEDKPINLRRKFFDQIKYPKIGFANSAHAFNLVDKLNEQFKTDQFNVRVTTVSEVVHRTPGQEFGRLAKSIKKSKKN